MQQGSRRNEDTVGRAKKVLREFAERVDFIQKERLGDDIY